MGNFKHTAVFAAGLAAVFAAAAPVLGDERALSLQSFGASRVISAYELSAPGVSGGAVQPTIAASLSGSSLSMPTSPAPSLASTTMLASDLALDSGQGLDVASRFTNYGGPASPFLSAVNAPYLALANGGRYAGVTFVPADNLRVRLGASVSSERLDRFQFDAGAPTGPLALTYDASQSNSLLGGLSFDVSSALGLDVTAIASQRSGVPLGFTNDAGIAPKSSTARAGRGGAHEYRPGLGHQLRLQRGHDAARPARQLFRRQRHAA
ncbi:MAG TPA: hypothetical protein VK515_05745 [Rhizomicrobium sp.]|nr:hypothetical protein [Rhizomicrobium sp.]